MRDGDAAWPCRVLNWQWLPFWATCSQPSACSAAMIALLSMCGFIHTGWRLQGGVYDTHLGATHSLRRDEGLPSPSTSWGLQAKSGLWRCCRRPISACSRLTASCSRRSASRRSFVSLPSAFRTTPELAPRRPCFHHQCRQCPNLPGCRAAQAHAAGPPPRQRESATTRPRLVEAGALASDPLSGADSHAAG